MSLQTMAPGWPGAPPRGGKDFPHCQPMAVGIHTLIALGEQPGAAVPDSTGKNQGD